MIPTLDKAIELLSKEEDPLKKICSSSAYWIPLQWAYVMILNNKDIEPIGELSKERKVELWNFVKGERPEKDNLNERWVYKMMAQAVYVYDKLK